MHERKPHVWQCKIMKRIDLIELKTRFERDNMLKQLAPKTMEYYAEFLGYFFDWLPAKVKQSRQLTQKLFDNYKLYIISKTGNRSSQNTYLRAVRRFYKFGAELDATPTANVKLPKALKKVKPTFSDKEVEIILNSRNTSKADVIALVLLTTGMRSATLRALTVTDFNPVENVLQLRHLKNGTETLLPIPCRLTNRLQRYIIANKLSTDELLFPNARGGQFTANGLNHFMNKYCRRKGFEHKGVHIFRHTYGKLMARNGCPSITLMHCLTHSSIQQSEQYVNLYGLELRDACNRYNPLNKLHKKSAE